MVSFFSIIAICITCRLVIINGTSWFPGNVDYSPKGLDPSRIYKRVQAKAKCIIFQMFQI